MLAVGQMLDFATVNGWRISKTVNSSNNYFEISSISLNKHRRMKSSKLSCRQPTIFRIVILKLVELIYLPELFFFLTKQCSTSLVQRFSFHLTFYTILCWQNTLSGKVSWPNLMRKIQTVKSEIVDIVGGELNKEY